MRRPGPSRLSLTRAYALAARHSASYAAFDVLEHPDGPVAARPYTERRALLADVPEGIGPPIQATLSTDSRTLAMEWCWLLIRMKCMT
ncbi:hypothetical protein ACFWHI_35845, partial [Streptomyces rochei]